MILDRPLFYLEIKPNMSPWIYGTGEESADENLRTLGRGNKQKSKENCIRKNL